MGLCVRVLLFAAFLALVGPAWADHTRQSREQGEISGLPSWCCSTQDCEYADVRLVSYGRERAFISVRGVVYEIVGRKQKDGTPAVWFDGSQRPAWCHRRGLEANCANVRFDQW